MRLSQVGMILVVAAGLLASLPSSAAAKDPETLKIGSAAPDFKLPGVDGKKYTLDSFRDAEILVIVFTCDHCPTAQAYEERIKRLAADYKDKHVALVAISPNDPTAVRLDEMGYTDVGDSLDDMKLRAKDHEFNFPYLFDGENQKVALAYGPVATPHVFVFDRARKLRFVGRIDNSDDPRRVTTHETRDAIEALLAGKAGAGRADQGLRLLDQVGGKARHGAQGRRGLGEGRGLVEINRRKGNPSTREERRRQAAAGERLGDLVRPLHRRASRTGRDEPDVPPPPIRVSDDLGRRTGGQGPGPEDAQGKGESSATNYLFDGNDKYKLMDAVDEKSTGALPCTLLVAPGGKVLYRKSGPIDPLELKKAIVGFLGRTYADDVPPKSARSP